MDELANMVFWTLISLGGAIYAAGRIYTSVYKVRERTEVQVQIMERNFIEIEAQLLCCAIAQRVSEAIISQRVDQAVGQEITNIVNEVVAEHFLQKQAGVILVSRQTEERSFVPNAKTPTQSKEPGAGSTGGRLIEHTQLAECFNCGGQFPIVEPGPPIYPGPIDEILAEEYGK